MFAAIINHPGVSFLVGVAIGTAFGAAVITVVRRKRQRLSVGDHLRHHFGNVPEDQIEVHSREFPYRVCVDAYEALNDWIAKDCTVDATLGVPVASNFMSRMSVSVLLSQNVEGCTLYPSSLEFDFFDVGEEQPRQCIKHAVWLLRHEGKPLVILWTSETSHRGCGFETKLLLDFARLKKEEDASLADSFFRCVEKSIQKATTYRGKILSLDSSADYRGNAAGIVVHRLRSVARDDVILPNSTVQLLERNVIRFTEQRAELSRLGIPTKKGLLLYGPPGTGKTHTIHYLIGALPGHTTLLITADQIGAFSDYITLARLLQPSIVVMEDIDLVGRHREHLSPGTESLLNRLLNEMDGLTSDAEIIFLMTTNRPEALERALASRPGRVDQAIEFPLPDEAGRRKLIRLYAAGAAIDDEVVSQTARMTDGVSASFIKELMRRAIQFLLECRSDGKHIRILQNDIDQAIDELLFTGGSLNRALLGAEGVASDNSG
jgi:ATPase family protein associated with various cellular activities (AAA)